MPTLQLTKKKSEKSIVGLEIEAGSVAAAEIKLGGGPTLSATAIAPLPEGAFADGEVVDHEAVTAALRRLFDEYKLSKRVRLGIANQRVVVRTLRLPSIDDPGDLDAAIRFEAEERIPMPIDQAVLDYRVVGVVAGDGEEGAKMDVVVVAARRDMIAAALRPLRDAGLEPVGVDLSAFGLIRALSNGQAAEPDTASAPIVLHCNVGEATNLAIARGRACLFTRVAPVGLERVAAELATNTGLPLEHARLWISHVGLAQPIEQVEGDAAFVAAVRATLESGISSILDEVRLSVDFYGAQEGAAPVEQLVLSGPAAAIPGFAERMGSTLAIPAVGGTPYPLTGLDGASAARLTLPYGLALDY
jgi:type IV pilus assembly protein PilM